MKKFKMPKLNPIVKKDLRVISRSMKIAWGIFAYEGVLAIIFLFAMWIIFESYNTSYGFTRNYGEFVAMFPILAAVQFGIIALLMPIMTATAVSGERERQTFDILLTTVMTPIAIIRGKVFSAVARVMVFIVASIPLMAVSFTLGGLSWINLLITMVAFLIFAILTGSVGIFASTLTTKSITAIILTYVFYFAIVNTTFIPALVITLISTYSGTGGLSVLMLFNPLVTLVEMFVLMLDGDDLFSSNSIGFLTGWIWVIVSGVVMLLASWLLQRLAARRIDPMNGYLIYKKDKKAKGQGGAG
ncbi:MAG: hypothetical protein IKI75_07375 [Lachnospiraceae bacterium]|nr:hypothetical protein [Lachnospiraceae bacterium]